MPPFGRSPSVLSLGLALVLGACGAAPSVPPSTAGLATPMPASAAPPTSPPPSTTAPSSQPSFDRTTGWQDDLARIIPALERIHPDPFHAASKADLEAAVADLSGRIPTLTDDDALVGLLRIVASVSGDRCDSHTGAFVWGLGTYPVTSLPLRLWLFEDQLVIVDSLPPHEELVGAVIEAIDDRPVADILAALEPLIPRDNDQTFRLLAPRYLLMPEVLRGLGLGLAEAGAVRITFTQPGGRAEADLDPVPMADYNAWAGPYGLHLPVDTAVPWLAQIDDALWWEVLSDGETLFVQHNRVDRLESGLLGDLRAALHGDGIERVVLDLRHNYGGEVSAIDPILELFDDPAIDRPGALFVMTGRNTYSAASMFAARLERDTAATFVGEPTGGCPTLWGDPEQVELPWTRIVVSIASELSVGVDPDDPRTTIEPDAAAEVTLDDWLQGHDPGLDLILGIGP